MKKVLKLILLVAMIASLSVAAFAVDSTETEFIDVSDVPVVTEAIAEVPENRSVEINATENADSAAAIQAAMGKDGASIPLGSFEIIVTDDTTGEQLHGANTGVTVTVYIVIPEEYVNAGYTLDLYEDGVLVKSIPITETPLPVVIDSFSTYTPVIVKAANGQGDTTDTPVVVVTPTTPQTSPQTMQSILPYALAAIAVLAIAGAVYARKRSFN